MASAALGAGAWVRLGSPGRTRSSLVTPLVKLARPLNCLLPLMPLVKLPRSSLMLPFNCDGFCLLPQSFSLGEKSTVGRISWESDIHIDILVDIHAASMGPCDIHGLPLVIQPATRRGGTTCDIF